uniref:Uncharacterized protein n=1 Tax=Oryza sativa subsp. japonica TaxID=39947 RepID=Q69KE6_ORYSJ|nr:hypothetical protein [Oryza sativa Japonica Group]BAD36594.1 hypothetical protein [Oryza sativa Japonica Group]
MKLHSRGGEETSRQQSGSRLFLARQEQQQRGVGVPVAKAQHPCGSCSRTANVVSFPKSKFILLSSKDREPPLLHHEMSRFTKMSWLVQ